MKERRTGWRPGRLANFTLLAGAVVIALAAAELMVRIVAPQQLILKRPDLWKAADTLGWTHHPNVTLSVNTGERTVGFLTDSLGYRVGRSPRPEGGYKILLLGDSFMEALQVEYEQSLAGLLESRLPRLVNRPVLVRNAAVGGWEPDQYLLHARRALVRESFDLVVISLFLENDVIATRREHIPPRAPALVHHLRFPSELSWRELVDAILYPVNDFLEVRSHLFILGKTRLQMPLMRMGLTEAQFHPVYLRSERNSERWAVTHDILRDIARLASGHEVPTLVAMIPASYQVDTTIFRLYTEGFRLEPSHIDLDQPDSIMGERLRQSGIPAVATLPVLRSAFRAGARPYGHVDRHFTPEGHALVAGLIEGQVAALLRAGPRRPAGRWAGTRKSYR